MTTSSSTFEPRRLLAVHFAEELASSMIKHGRGRDFPYWASTSCASSSVSALTFRQAESALHDVIAVEVNFAAGKVGLLRFLRAGNWRRRR